MNDNGNKSITQPNKNFQIFINHSPSHSMNIVELKDDTHIATNKVIDRTNVVNLIDKEEPKPNHKLNITFISSDVIKEVDGPLYITMKIRDKL